MEKIRAEPGKHRLDNGFMKWSQETIEANKKNADGVHVTAQSNGTNSAAAYFAKNYSNCMNQKTTEPED